MFADSRCERPLFSWTADGLDGQGAGAPPEFVTVASGPRCAPVYAVRRAEVFSADRAVFAPVAGGGCVAYPAEVSASALAGKGWLAAGEPVPDSRFAEGRRVVTAPPPGQRLSDEVIESAAGGPFLVGVHDARWQRGCDLRGRDEGDAQCWPPTAETTWGRFLLFTDQTCATRLAAYDADDDSCEEPALVSHEGALHELGERWSVAPYSSYAVEEPTCTNGPESPRPPRTFLVGAALDADALARLQLRPQGAGQVRLIGPEADDGRPFDLPAERQLTSLGPSVWLAGRAALFERAGESPCAPFRAPDGAIRCLPLGDLVPISDIFFSDERCSQPLVSCTECAGKQVLVPAPSADPFGAASAVHELGP
ncbi:MAG TPA: hypothetical protein VFS00_19935, partial [Polyangiaceae bacterium]|nr:hypothetical protein [Polyangiaceae bacterium]